MKNLCWSLFFNKVIIPSFLISKFSIWPIAKIEKSDLKISEKFFPSIPIFLSFPSLRPDHKQGIFKKEVLSPRI